MITRNTDYSIQHLRGLSTDTKPIDVPNGSEFREMDTGKKFLYSAAGTEWIEQPCCGGGSGGGGSVEPLTVLSQDIDGVDVLDKTWQEIFDALIARRPVYYSKVNNGANFAAFVPISHAYYSDGSYYVPVMGQGGKLNRYSTDSVDGYPRYKNLVG